jgi:hypothetical protein
VNRKTETKRTSSKVEDSFERARRTFFGTGQKIIKVQPLFHQFFKMPNDAVVAAGKTEHIFGGSKNE